MNVLCTGSKGFIGSETCRLLSSKGHRVRGFDLLDGEDVTDKTTVEYVVATFKPQAIVHLAAQVFLKPSLDNPQEDARTNIIGTLNVLEAARKYGARLILSSSGAIYGSNDRTNIRETHEPEPMSPYGISKLSSERYVLLWNDLYGMGNVVFRFSSVYGAGRKKTSVNLIVDKAIKQANYETGKAEFEEIIVTGDGVQTRDFTHVSDVAQAVLMAVEGHFPKGIYNIGTGTSTSINQLISTVEQILGQKLIVKYTEKSKGDPLKNDFNVEKAEGCGFRAKIKLEDGLRQLISDLASAR